MNAKLTNEYVDKFDINGKEHVIKIICFDSPVFSNNAVSCKTLVSVFNEEDVLIKSLALPEQVKESEKELVFSDIKKLMTNETNWKCRTTRTRL